MCLRSVSTLPRLLQSEATAGASSSASRRHSQALSKRFMEIRLTPRAFQPWASAGNSVVTRASNASASENCALSCSATACASCFLADWRAASLGSEGFSELDSIWQGAESPLGQLVLFAGHRSLSFNGSLPTQGNKLAPIRLSVNSPPMQKLSAEFRGPLDRYWTGRGKTVPGA